MTGFIKPEVLETFKDDNGTSFVAAATRVGYTAASPQVSQPVHGSIPPGR